MKAGEVEFPDGFLKFLRRLGADDVRYDQCWPFASGFLYLIGLLEGCICDDCRLVLFRCRSDYHRFGGEFPYVGDTDPIFYGADKGWLSGVNRRFAPDPPTLVVSP